MTEPAVGSARRRVLLTVSGVVPQGLADAVASGSRPRVDYVEMAKAFEADLVDYAEAARRLGRTGRLIERVLGKNIALAWCCFTLRHSYDVIMTDGEQVGLPYAAFTMVSGRRRARHLMIVHILSVPKKAVLFRLLRLVRVARHLRRFGAPRLIREVRENRWIQDHLGYVNFFIWVCVGESTR